MKKNNMIDFDFFGTFLETTATDSLCLYIPIQMGGKTAKYTYKFRGGHPKERLKSLFTEGPTADHYCLS